MKNINFIFVVFLSLFFSCNEDDLFENFSDPNYPTRYCVLSEVERSDLLGQLNAENFEYFSIDSFGFLEFNSDFKVEQSINK